MEKELNDASTAYRRVAAVLQGSFRTSLREYLEPILNTPVHETLRSLPMSEYMEPPVIEKTGVSFTGEPVYYVNGIWTKKDTAMEAAEALSEKLERPVNLVYNPSELNPPEYSTGTPGVFGDVTEAARDVLWPLLICTMPQDQEQELSNGNLQPNPTTRQFTHLFFHAKKPVSVVSHSQGCIIVRNACFSLGLLGKEDWVRHDLAWVAAGTPLTDGETWPRPERHSSIKDPNDPVPRIIGRAGLDAFEMSGVAIKHGFVQHYVKNVKPEMLW